MKQDQARHTIATLPGVTTKTMRALAQFDTMLSHHAQTHNLIAKSTLPIRWERHFLDSAQLCPLVSNDTQHVMDFGSGAGFPGLVLAICAEYGGLPSVPVTLVDSRAKKCAFLEQVCTTLGLEKVTIVNTRIEDYVVTNSKADLITARALAPLSTLLSYAVPLLAPEGRCLFLKGAKGHQEKEDASLYWHFDEIAHKSCTSDDAVILELRNIRRV